MLPIAKKGDAQVLPWQLIGILHKENNLLTFGELNEGCIKGSWSFPLKEELENALTQRSRGVLIDTR